MASAEHPQPRQTGDPLSFIENTLWRWLNSLPIAIGVMLLLAILSAIGTFIPQVHMLKGAAAMNPEQFYHERFGAERYALINALGLTRIYFTWYFFSLLLWLSISAVVCNITRFRKTLAQWRRPHVERSMRGFTSDKRAIVLEAIPADAVARLKTELARERFRTREQDAEGAVCVYADRGFTKKWALVLLHFALIVLLIGAIYGKMFGVEGWIRLDDGQKDTLALDVKEHKLPFVQKLLGWVKPMEYQLSQDHFRIDYDEHLELPPGMAAMPQEMQDYSRYFVKQFVSILTVEQGGKTKTQEVSVNHPLVLNKLVLYQSGYGQQGTIIAQHGSESQEYPAPSDTWLALAPSGLVDAQQAIGMGQPISNLAFLLEPIKAGDLYKQGVKSGVVGPLTLAHVADVDSKKEWTQLFSVDQPLKVTLMGEAYTLKLSPQVANYSEFSYKRDPGIPVLYLGWIALIVGITLGLYIPFTQVWLRFEHGRVFIVCAGPGGMRARHAFYARWRDILEQP
jgi:cytochrome c biogenesis protein